MCESDKIKMKRGMETIMKKLNTIKTRLIIFETLRPAWSDLLESINKDYYDVVAIVDNESSDTYSVSVPVVSFEEILDFSFWDLLIINDEAFEDEIRGILSVLKLPEERYFFLSKLILWDEFLFYRTLFDKNSKNGKKIDFFARKHEENYQVVTTRGGDYITHVSDREISYDMFMRKKCYSQDEIDTFIYLAKQYYGIEQEEKGFFFDIGANIGTTCIYAKKYLVPNMSVVAFEPLFKNYKVLLANIILNEITDYIAVNKAVSDVSDSYNMNFNAANPGGSAIVSGETDLDASDLQSVDSVSIDEFLTQNHIDPGDVRYVWIDTEGFEANVLNGARLLLEQKRTAFYIEYAPHNAGLERLKTVADICKQYFEKFICMDDFVAGDTRPRPIEELYELYQRYPVLTNVFLIK